VNELFAHVISPDTFITGVDQVRNKIIAASVISLAFILSGCQSPMPKTGALERDTHAESVALLKEKTKVFSPQQNGISEVASLDEVPGNAKRSIEWDSERGNFAIESSGPLSTVIDEAAKQAGYYTVIYVDGVDKRRQISINIKNVSPEQAIKKAAWIAGYIAVIDKKSRMITLTDQGVYTFKLTNAVIQQMVQQVSSTYSMTPGSAGSSSSSSGGGMAGMSSGGAVGGAGGGATFTVSGRSAQAAGGNGFYTYIQGLAGKNAEVTLSQDMGMITVRSNAIALERVRQVLNKAAFDASRAVRVEATFVDVSLQDQFQFGINWSRVLQRAGGTLTYGIGSGTSAISNATASLVANSTSTQSLIDALKTFTNTNVISQPSIITSNRVPATFFSGGTTPFLGSLVTNATQTSVSVTGSLSYADAGIKLSVIPDIVSDHEVSMMVMPSLSALGNEMTWQLGTGTTASTLTDYPRTHKESTLSVDIENGATVIIGGLRSTNATKSKNSLPGNENLMTGANANSLVNELVLLIHAEIIPGHAIETLYSESL